MSKLFQILWPHCLNEEELNPIKLFDEYVNACDGLGDNMDVALGSRFLENSKYIFVEEEERRDRLERTATTILSSTAIVVVLIVAMSKFVFGDKILEKTLLISIFSIASYGISLIYFFMAFIYALRVFASVSRHYLGPIDIAPQSKENVAPFSIRIGKKFLECTIENYKINNREMNKTHVARSMLRNAIVTLLLSGVLIYVQLILGSS